jgi:NADH-quinone oxidoreductase subunit K|tara:strand:+ start:656 stop:961 length:306 start_codon:yes stop_codon:yes gene_type:complete
MALMQEYLILSSIVFIISLFGLLINRKNVISLLMCIELMLLAVNTNFITFSQYHQLLSGQIFVLFILAVAAAESAIGLAIFVLMYRNTKTVDLDNMAILRG